MHALMMASWVMSMGRLETAVVTVETSSVMAASKRGTPMDSIVLYGVVRIRVDMCIRNSYEALEVSRTINSWEANPLKGIVRHRTMKIAFVPPVRLPAN